jgi:hypothetical protein
VKFSVAGMHEIDAVWPQVSEGLDKACQRGGDLNMFDLYERARTGRAFLLIAFDTEIRGAAVCLPEQWASGVKLHVLAFYGDRFRAWRDEFMDAVRALGKRCGTDTAIFAGPEAYRRIFPEAKVRRVLYEVK